MADLNSQHRVLTGDVEAELVKARAEVATALEALNSKAEQSNQAQSNTIRRLRAQARHR